LVRYVVYGAGAVGGAIGASLFAAGRDVVLIARGAHYDVLVTHGLTLQLPDGPVVHRVPTVDHPAKLDFGRDDVVLFTMKSQDTEQAARTLSSHAPTDTPVACLQNGVENERITARYFSSVLSGMVITPATFIAPGAVVVAAAPTLGICDVGHYPRGTDTCTDQLVGDLTAASWSALPRDDVTRWKYAKLLENLSNAAQVVLGLDYRDSDIAKMARAEGVACLKAAGIEFATQDEMRDRRSGSLAGRPVAGRDRVGASTWQSVVRGTGSVESDYLNGEIALLGRLHGIPTPVNVLLQRVSNAAAREHRNPGVMTEADVFEALGREDVSAS